MLASSVYVVGNDTLSIKAEIPAKMPMLLQWRRIGFGHVIAGLSVHMDGHMHDISISATDSFSLHPQREGFCPITIKASLLRYPQNKKR